MFVFIKIYVRFFRLNFKIYNFIFKFILFNKSLKLSLREENFRFFEEIQAGISISKPNLSFTRQVNQFSVTYLLDILVINLSEEIEFKINKLNNKTKKFTESKKLDVWDGICNIFERNYNKAFRYSIKRYYERFLTESECRDCNGERLNITARNVFVGKLSINQITNLNIEDALVFFEKLKLDSMKTKIAEKIIFTEEIKILEPKFFIFRSFIKIFSRYLCKRLNKSRAILIQSFYKKIDIDNNNQKLSVLRALDKIDRLGWEAVKQLLGKGRKDKSGDFTKGANLSTANIETVEKELYKKCFMCRTSHLIGLDVHDVVKYLSKNNPSVAVKFTEGNVLTIEPGCYIRPSDNVPKEFWGIGVRIEDDVLVTSDGYDVLSKNAPTEINELEAIIGTSSA